MYELLLISRARRTANLFISSPRLYRTDKTSQTVSKPTRVNKYALITKAYYLEYQQSARVPHTL